MQHQIYSKAISSYVMMENSKNPWPEFTYLGKPQGMEYGFVISVNVDALTLALSTIKPQKGKVAYESERLKLINRILAACKDLKLSPEFTGAALAIAAAESYLTVDPPRKGATEKTGATGSFQITNAWKERYPAAQVPTSTKQNAIATLRAMNTEHKKAGSYLDRIYANHFYTVLGVAYRRHNVLGLIPSSSSYSQYVWSDSKGTNFHSPFLMAVHAINVLYSLLPKEAKFAVSLSWDIPPAEIWDSTFRKRFGVVKPLYAYDPPSSTLKIGIGAKESSSLIPDGFNMFAEDIAPNFNPAGTSWTVDFYKKAVWSQSGAGMGAVVVDRYDPNVVNEIIAKNILGDEYEASLDTLLNYLEKTKVGDNNLIYALTLLTFSSQNGNRWVLADPRNRDDKSDVIPGGDLRKFSRPITAMRNFYDPTISNEWITGYRFSRSLVKSLLRLRIGTASPFSLLQQFKEHRLTTASSGGVTKTHLYYESVLYPFSMLVIPTRSESSLLTFPNSWKFYDNIRVEKKLADVSDLFAPGDLDIKNVSEWWLKTFRT